MYLSALKSIMVIIYDYVTYIVILGLAVFCDAVDYISVRTGDNFLTNAPLIFLGTYFDSGIISLS